MTKKPTLQSIASKMNPESLVYDRHADRFVRIPAALSPFPETPENPQTANLSLQPSIKFIPELNPEHVFQTPLGAELVNTTGKNVKFVSEHTFNSGVHEIELLNYVSFKNTKLKALHTSSKGKVTEFPLNLDAFGLDTALIVKLDLNLKRLTVHSPSSLKKSEISLKGSKFRLAIEFKSIGDFVSVNPLYLVRGVNNIWTFNNRIMNSKFIELSKNWIFLKEVDGATEGVLTGLLKEIAGVDGDGNNSQDLLFDSASKIAAIRVAGDRLKEARKVAKGKSEVSRTTLKSVLRLVYHNLPFEQQLQNTELIDFVTKHKERFVAVNRDRNLAELVAKLKAHEPAAIESTYNAAPGTAKVEYLDSEESLLLFNGVNKLKVISERSRKQEFVVNPFIFDTSRVNFSLSTAEFNLLFRSLDWKDLAERLKLPAEESQSLEKAIEALLSDNNLVTDGEYYHFGLDSALVQSIVWRAFEYVNLIIESAYPHELADEDQENSVVVDSCPADKSKGDDAGGSELVDLFNEEKHKTRVSDMSLKPLKDHLDSFFRNNFECFPTEFDGILAVLFKVEEALFLQAPAYRKAAKVISRSHTALSRLFSFVASPLPLSQVKRLVDFGLYINSAFVNEFKHFRHEKCAYNDFNDQNVVEVALKAYTLQKLNPHGGVVPKDNISLAFSVSHMPAWTCGDKIDRVFVLKGGKFVGVVTDSKVLHLLSTQFGLVELFKTNLGAPVSWTAPKTFEGLIKNNVADIKDIEPEEPEVRQPDSDKQTAEAASGKKSEAAQPPPPPPKPEEMEKVVDKGMLDMLYNMGFPLDICKKALYEVKSSSFEEALNQVFKLKEENFESVGPVKKKVMHMQLKPEWECKVCTLVNVVDFTSQTPDVCDACGNVADQDAYFEEEEEEIITEPQVEPERQFKSEETLQPTDYVLSMELVSLKRDNLLHKDFLVLAVRRLDKVHLLVSRLAVAESLIKHIAFQDPKTKAFASWPGFNLLKKGLVERDLGFNYSQFYEEKILGILAFSLAKDIYVETNRKQFAVEMKDEVRNVFVNQHASLNARGSEELLVYASGAKLTQIIALTNKSRSYCANDFDIQLSETLEATDLKLLHGVTDQLLLATAGNTVTGYTAKLQQTGFKSEIGEHTRILSATTERLTVLHQDGRVSKLQLKIDEFKLANEYYHKALSLLRNKRSSNQQDDFVSPQILLSFFKTQSNIAFKPSKLRNIYKQLPSAGSVFSLRAAPIDKKTVSAIEIRKIGQEEGCNINFDVYVKAAKDTAEIQNFITAPISKDLKHRKTFSNSYTKLELRCIDFGGNPFSKSVHYSQMLSNDGEYFATKTPFNMFVFESAFERVMKVKKVILELSANMLTNSIIDEVLVFVFSDLSLLSSMNALTDFSLMTVENAVKNGSLLPGIEPCMKLSLKKDGGCKVTEELELARVGKYIAFLPLKGGAVTNPSAKPLDCFQYFSVEGDYETDQSLDSLTLGCLSTDAASNTHDFQGYSIKIFREGKEEQLNNFKIVSVQETKTEYIAKLRGSLSLLGKVDRLDVHLPGSVNDLTPLSVQITLSNISHSLIMKIKEQMEAGSSEKLTTIFKQYNDKILGIDAENQPNFESNYLNLIDLLLFILETFGEKMVEPVLKIDFRQIMYNCVLNSKEGKVIGGSRFLLEKLFGFASTNEHFKAIFFEVLKELPKAGITFEGLEAFWKLLANFVQGTSSVIREQTLAEVYAHITKVVSKTETLNTPNNMLLRSLSIFDTLNMMPVFKPEAKTADSKTNKSTDGSAASSSQKPNLVEAVDSSTLVEYNGQSYHDKNYAEYLINCTELIKLDQVLIRFPKIKPLLSTAFEVQVFNAETECFEVVKLKHLGSDFSNYLSAKELSADPASLRHYHLGLSFVNYDKPVKLLRIVSRVNHIPVFDYTDHDSTHYELFIHGTKIETLVAKAELGDEEKQLVDTGMVQLYARRCNQKYASYNDEVSVVPNVKAKTREWTSSVVYLKAKSKGGSQETEDSGAKTETRQTDALTSTEVKDAIDALNRIKETIEDQLQGIEVADLRSNSPISNAITAEVDQYRAILDSKKSNFPEAALSENMSFWLADLDMFIAEFSKIVSTNENFQLLFASGASAEDVLARIFFDGLFFEKREKTWAIQTFLSDSIKLMGQDEPLKMLNKLCTIYQSFGNAVFVSNLDKFMDILNALKLTTIENWISIVQRIVQYTNRRPEELSQEELKKLLLDANLLNMASIDQAPISQELFLEAEKITVWLLSNKLEVVNKKFEDIALVLLGQMFKAMAPEQKGDIEISPDALRKIFELTALNGMLPKVDKTIADFVRLVAKVKPSSAEAKRFKGLMNLLKMTLMAFVTEQVVESDAAQLYGSEKVSEILFFALSQIKAMDEVQNSLTAEREEDATKISNVPTPTPIPTIQPVAKDQPMAPLPKKSQKSERSNSLIQVTAESDPVLSLFVNDILKFMNGRNIQDIGLISIITNFTITEHMNPQLLIGVTRFAISQPKEVRQTIIQDLGLKVADIHKKLKTGKSKVAVREFSSLTIEVIIDLLKNHLAVLNEDPTVAHFAISLALQVIHENEPKIVVAEQCKLPLRPHLAAQLLTITANILAERFNFGGPENFQNFIDTDLNLFELLSYCLHIVLRGVDDSGSTLLTFLVQNYKSLRETTAGESSELDGALESLSIWILCNYSAAFPELKSVVGPILKKVHSDVILIISELFTKEEAAKVLLNSICSNFRRLNTVLTKKVEKRSLGYLGLYMNENSIDFFEWVLKITAENEILANHFLLANKGLELIFEILHRSNGETQNPAIESSQRDSLLSQMRKATRSPPNKPTSDPAKTIVSPNKDKAIFEEEFGARITNIQLDKSISSGAAVKDWCSNKSGKNSNIYNTSIPINRKSISLRFKATEDFELKTMRLSLVVARSENYLVVGPAPYVHLYAIQEDEKKDTRRIFLGELKRVNDPGYLLFNSVVYAFNINKLNGRDFGSAIDALKHVRELREFELVIGRPLFTTVDRTSPLINRSISAVNLSINFLSVEGFTHTKIDIQGVFKAKVQASFSKFLEIIFNADNFVRPIDEYFDAVNREKRANVYELIESQLGPIMANFEEKMAKLLMTLSEKNKRLADSIFSFLLKNVEKKSFFSLLIERIFKKTMFYRYLFDFVDFGRRKLMGDPAVLSRFLAVLTNYLAFLATKMEMDGQQVALALPIDEKFFGAVLAAHKQSPFTFQIERFVVFTIALLLEGKLFTNLPSTVAKADTYLLPTEHLKQEESKALGRQLLGLLVERVVSGEAIFLHLLGSLINRCQEAKQAVITHKLIESVAERLQPKTADATVEVMLFLQTASEDPELYPLITSNGIDQRLIVLIEDWVRRKPFKDNIDLVNTVLKTIFSIFKHSQSQIDQLEQVLFGILKRNTDDSFFIEKVLLKFFEFEFTKKTAFVVRRTPELPASKPVDQQPEAGKTSDPKVAPLQIKSTYMSTERFNHLSAQLPRLVDEKTERLIRNFEWKKIVETNEDYEDFSPQYEPLMYQKRPSLILMTLDNSGTIGFLGLFVPEGFVKYADQNDGVAYVPNSDNTFIFWYSENTFVHYKPALDHCDKFLKYVNFDGAKSISLAVDDVDKIMISLSQEAQSNFEIDQMKVIASDNNPDFEFPFNCALNSIEIFQLEIKADEKAETVSEAAAELLAGKYVDKLGGIDVQGSMFGEAIFHELPEQLSLKALKTAVPALILTEDLKEKTLGDISEPRTVLGVVKDVALLSRNVYQTFYNPRLPIFEVFLSRGGIQYVIESVKSNENIPLLKEKSQQENWRQLMDDLLDLQCIDGFLSAMTQSKDFLPVIFELFIGTSKSNRNWEDAEFAISNLMFEKLASILKNSDSLAMRFTFFEKNVLRKLLDKLRQLTFDLVRVYKEDEVDEQKGGQAKNSEPVFDKDEPLLKEVKKRKGVGYEKEGSGKKWIVTEYLAKKKVRNEFIVSLLKLFRNLFSLPLEGYKPEDKNIEALRKSWFRTVAESSLLPMLEGAFKTSSLQEMSKESEVYEQLCDVLLTIGKQQELRPLMLQLPPQYKPVQLESMIQIIKKQEENTHLFKNFAQTGISKAAEGEEKLHSIELANLILDTIDKIKKMYPEQFEEGGDEEYENITDQDISAIQELPVNEQYKIAFKNLRFDLVDFKKPNDTHYDHHYSSNIDSDAKSSSPARMVRLAQEITDLSSSLPIDSYNAITVRADVNRLDVIKAIIAGAENTPYAHGLFEYHVYLPSEYPSGPPKCNLETTGNGDVRFNPNLYSCGKVCLSLLGTWRGSASENWDPKISNLLQLFLSIQSVVMSEEVYFNEPGYEGEAGTEEGEKKNEGYSNIVRINNIKHAMIKQIKTPPVGFEDVVRRHFYIKRHVILKEVGKWVKFAEVRPCSYSGLVSDHNNKYSSKFTNSKVYLSDLKSAIADLEKTLKELVLNSDPHHIFANKKLTHGRSKQKAKAKKTAAVELKAIEEKVDTAWDDIKKSETFDANDKRVADRWSRYIGAMGIEAVKKQSTAKVAIVGLNVLGLEIAKNIVLSGVHTLTLIDWRTVSEDELLGNFYATQADVGVNRATCVKSKIQQLNFYVKVEDVDLVDKPALDFIADQTVLVITDNYLPQTRAMLEAAKEKKVKVIIAETVGAYARIFVDFGAAFVVNDRDGEDPSECYIKSIDQTTNTISLFDKSFNQLRDGDYIVISEAESGAAEGDRQQDLNESIHKIKQMKKVTEIEVEDLSKFRPYQRNGKIKELKVPLTHKFRDYSEVSLATLPSFMDENLAIHDFMKLDSVQHVSQCFLLKERLEESAKVAFSQSQLAKLIELASEEQKKDEKFMKRLSLFWATSRGHLHSLDAFIGGMVSQEVIIGITGKFTPIKQLFCTDIEEVVCDELKTAPELLTEDQLTKFAQLKGKYGKLSFLVGEALMKKLREARLFMVGAGAIGCELLKNCAMVGLGSGESGSITLTDPDSIELSNLNRQFLFREKHISKPKSLVAASVVQSMNEDYKGRMVARLEKVCDDTEEVYNDQFIQRQSICLNALDNIKARVYMDQRCVKNHVPLLESGTLGPKGHVQVILPGVTENYAQVRDANEEHNIPVCTLKMFPEEPVHCMEWAKDRFEVLFAQNPKSVERVLEEFKAKGDVSAVYAKIKKAVLKLLKNRPKSQQEAVEAARRFYQKNFANKINQLMHVYPLDHKTKEGKLFWTLPKRPPVARNFDLADPLDAKFIDSYARLLCRIWGLEEKLPEGEQLQKTLAEVKIEPFKPKDSDAAKIKKDVENMEKKEVAEPKEEKDPEQQESALGDETKLNSDLNALLATLNIDALLKQVRAEVFEKDNDANNHIDVIYCLSALRSKNYKLPEMDWMTTKLKAGRIVPALATTTATIAALQTIEAIKLIKGNKVEELKNCFLNLAIPNMTLSEPGPAAKFKIHDSLTVTVWDRWNFEFSETSNNLFKDLIDHIESTYKLHVVDVLKDNKPIFLAALNKRADFDKVPLADLLELEVGESCYLSMICKLTPESEKSVANLPLVKVVFK